MNSYPQRQLISAKKQECGAARQMRRMMSGGVLLCCALLLSVAQARAQSALDGFDPGANGFILAIAVQADGKIIVGGSFSMLGGGGTGTTQRSGIGRLNADGSVDNSFNPGASSNVRAIAVQPDGKILVGGDFTMLGGGGFGTTPRNKIGRLNPDGSLDMTFDPGASNFVTAIAVQADGKIIVVGQFFMLGGGGTGTTSRSRIGRLNPDGSLDTSFNPGANNPVNALAVQADGKILVGGAFVMLGGGGTGTTFRSRIGRLNPDGSLDTSFNPGADDTVYALAVQADGKILVGGSFNTLGGGGTGTTPRHSIGRLNPDGSLDTSFDPGANGTVNAIAQQADGKILVGGSFVSLGGGGMGTTTRNSIGRLNPDGSLDTSFDPGANSTVIALAVQADGKIIVGGDFNMLGGGGMGTITRNKIGRLNPDGTLETNFDPGANSFVRALAVQADGKILVGGNFTTLGGGGTGTPTRNFIGRLNPDGTLDTTFNPGADNEVFALAVQADGKIIVGGFFTMLGGGGFGTTTRNGIGRLNPDGSLDMTFDPGADSLVNAIAVQADGKIIVGGGFTMLGGGGFGTTTRNRIGRLNADGSVDMSFNPGANSDVNALAVQTDGKILVGGFFAMLGGGGTGMTGRSHIGRLNADGSLDTSFNPGANDTVFALAVQADRKIIVGGDFSGLGGGTGTTARNRIGRLNADGMVDTTFNPGTDSLVLALAVQADGKIVVGGNFSGLGGGTGTTTRNRIGRLNPDGSPDMTFDPGANNLVNALAVQADGKIIVGGGFTMLGGGGFGTTTRNRIGRLTNTDAALQNLTVSFKGTSVRWLRSGASPELARVTFELSTDGITYTPLSRPLRITGGWLLTGLSLPTQQNLYVRARGFYSTGLQTGSYSVVESIRNAYVTIPQAANATLFDFDGDKLSDVAVWNPNNHNWYVLRSSTGTTAVQLDWGNGSLGDISVPADYDGDGKTDIAVYRPSEGNFYVIKSQTNAPSARNWGGGADIPVPADYDGDGKADIAVFRPSEGNWYIINSQSNTVTVKGWGTSTDKPMPRDYDGDGRADIAIFRPAEGNWYIINSRDQSVTLRNWGASTDKLVPADYDGDGRADLAVFRPAEGNWYIINSATSLVTVKNWGNSSDLPVAADYDGDGLADIAVWRPSEGNWYIIGSSTGGRTAYLGTNGDVPAPSTVVR